MVQNNNKISANEIRQWCFCPRQWYLYRTTSKVKNIHVSARKRGVAFHHSAARPVRAIQRLQRAIVTIAVIGGIACLILFLAR